MTPEEFEGQRQTLELRKLEAEIEKENQHARYLRAQADDFLREARWDQTGAHVRRVYDFSSEVNDDTVREAITTLGEWASYSRDPIAFHIVSPGGDAVSGLALYDYLVSLRTRGIHLTTVALGWAASMAGVLLQAGDHRLVAPNTSLLIHEASQLTWGKTSEIDDYMQWVKSIQDRLLTILSSRSTMTREQIRRRWTRKDWWLDAGQAVNLGFADGLWEGETDAADTYTPR